MKYSVRKLSTGIKLINIQFVNCAMAILSAKVLSFHSMPSKYD